MKSFKKILGSTIASVVALSTALLVTTAGNASAACFQYSATGMQTSTTPVFNNICGVPSLLSSNEGQYPIGDESDFVRIRQNVSGNDTVSKDNPKLHDQLSAACNSGDKFDVWTYVHNDASQDFNNNGSGSAVAKDVKVALAASQLNTTNSNFNFGSTVSASNATSVSDSATLSCNGKQVKLTLVPGSVHYNNNLQQTSYGNLSDSVVNSTTGIGSPVWPTSGGGTEWGCWDYRIVVVYEVQVQVIPPAPEVTAKCDMLGVVADQSRKVTVNKFNFTAKNATVKSIVLNWGDNSANTTLTNANEVVGQTQPTTLVNTGAGSTLGLFAAVTAAGAVAYRYMLGRRLSRQ
jgi:hypothetical protein